MSFSIELVGLLLAISGAIYWAGNMNAKLDALISMVTALASAQREADARIDKLAERVSKLENA